MHSMRNHRLLIIVGLFSLIALGSTVLPGRAVEDQKKLQNIQKDIEDKRDEYQSLQDKASVYKENLKTKQQEKTTLNNQLEILDEGIALTKNDIASAENEIEILGLEIDQLQIEITHTQTNIDNKKDQIGFLIRDLYDYDQQTYLEVALSNSTLSGFSAQVQYTEDVNQQFNEKLNQLQDLKKELKSDKQDLTDKKTQQEDKKDDLEVHQLNLEGEVVYKNQLLEDVAQDEEKFQQLVDDIKAEQQSINSEITTLEQSARQTLDKLSKNGTTPSDGTLNPSDPNRIIELPTSFQPDWPVNGIVTAYFKDPTYPFRSYFEHSAIDIGVPHGTPIRAADSGVVSVVRYDGTTNYSYVAVVHADNFQTVYGHVSQVYVQPQQVVEKGDIIAATGATPGTIGAGSFTTGPHLHFEIWLNNIKVDPLLYLP